MPRKIFAGYEAAKVQKRIECEYVRPHVRRTIIHLSRNRGDENNITKTFHV